MASNAHIFENMTVQSAYVPTAINRGSVYWTSPVFKWSRFVQWSGVQMPLEYRIDIQMMV